MALGLYQPPLPPLELAPGEEAEWVELRPRWPLTGEKHARGTPPNRSSKAASKQARSLTDETREALAAGAATAVAAGAAGSSDHGGPPGAGSGGAQLPAAAALGGS